MGALPMRLFPRSRLLLALAFAAACSDSNLAPSPSTEAISASAALSHGITVMTRNMYVGNDVDAIIAALASGDPGAAARAVLEGADVLRRTDFPARANAMAAEIARYRPHVVGLQEVEELHINLLSFGFGFVLDQNFLDILQAALAAYGLPNYVVAAQVATIDATPAPGISIADHEVLLVDEDRVEWNPATVVAANYAANVGPVAPGVSLIRGFVIIDAIIGGQQIRIASTHLESGEGAALSGLRALQAGELLSEVGSASPAILLGDFNDPAGTPMYALLRDAGFADVWTALRPGARGFTCCHDPDLSNNVSVLDERIDFVFSRGIAGPQGKVQGQVTIIGDQPGDRVEGPDYRIWPSDHAGLMARFLEPPASGLALR
jgi:hypothetical protein